MDLFKLLNKAGIKHVNLYQLREEWRDFRTQVHGSNEIKKEWEDIKKNISQELKKRGY
jgi:hypothetical protein